jgi:cysteine synthase A
MKGALYAKIEFTNPGASKKDRIALRMIDEALADGRLKPGQTVIELTSGNTGTGLAIVCAARGLKFIAVMSTGNSVERRRMIEGLGAKVELVPQAPGSPPGQVSGADLDLVKWRAEKLTKELGAFRCDQFRDEANVRAHEEGTAQEIWKDLGGKVTAFCDFVGSGGTFVGVSRASRSTRRSAAMRSSRDGGRAVRPAGDARTTGSRAGLFDEAAAWDDRSSMGRSSSHDEATHWAREMGRVEGSSAALVGREPCGGDADDSGGPGRLVNDSGLKYLSTDLWP